MEKALPLPGSAFKFHPHTGIPIRLSRLFQFAVAHFGEPRRTFFVPQAASGSLRTGRTPVTAGAFCWKTGVYGPRTPALIVPTDGTGQNPLTDRGMRAAVVLLRGLRGAKPPLGTAQAAISVMAQPYGSCAPDRILPLPQDNPGCTCQPVNRIPASPFDNHMSAFSLPKMPIVSCRFFCFFLYFMLEYTIRSNLSESPAIGKEPFALSRTKPYGYDEKKRFLV